MLDRKDWRRGADGVLANGSWDYIQVRVDESQSTDACRPLNDNTEHQALGKPVAAQLRARIVFRGMTVVTLN